MTAIKDMTPAQIEARLAEIKAREAELAPNSRDATQAIYEALMNGEDVSAVENETDTEAKQRTANAKEKRRLNIERKALLDAVPQAVAREGEASIAALRTQHEDLGAQAEQVRDELLATVATLKDTATRWNQLREQGGKLGRQARQIANDTGATPGHSFGVFTSATVGKALNDLHGLANHTRGEAGVGHPSTPLD
ncbi:hypothetical protein GCM10027040_05160 [Halomonas shantousis]